MLHPDQTSIASAAAARRAAGSAEVERMVRGAAGGCDVAWAALVERFTARVRGVARAHRLTPADADDVVQTTWLRLVEHIDRVREPRAVGAWLEQTARRESLRKLAAAQRECPADADDLPEPPSAPVAFDRVAAAELRAALATALAELPARQGRLIALLVADDGPSYADISRTLDMPIGSIGPTRERGLRRLRHSPRLLEAVGERAA